MIPILYDHAEKDFTSQGICRLADAVDCFVTEERNGIYECELKYPIDGLYFEEIFEGRMIGATHDDNDDIQPFEIYKHSAPIDGIVTFYAHHLSYRLRNHILTPFHASSCTEAMNVMKAKSLNYCPFNFFTDVSTLGNFDVEYPVSIKSRLAGDGDSILNLYGPGEFKYDKWNVSFLESRGVDHGVEIRYGKNLTDITREYDESEVYTAIVPYWFKEDSEGHKTLVTLDEYGVIVSESDAVQHVFWTNENDEIIRDEQGHPIEFSSENMIYAPLDLTSEFDDAPTQAQLATRAKQLFEAAQPWLPEDNIKISFVALWQTPEYEDYAPLEKVSLCDIVHVIHTRISVMVDAEVIKTVYNVLLDRYNEIELGSPQASYADEIASDTQAALEEIQKQLRRSVTADYVNEQIENATDKITGGLGGYVKVTLNANNEPQEILIMDHPSTATAVNVIRINQAGIGFSQRGYQGPFNSAWLIDGTFDAQVINVVNLAATVIRTGFLTDAQGYNYWNLETGEFRLSSTAMLDTYKEYSYVATRDYAVGDKIEIQTDQDTLIYEVTTTIPKDATIQPGVNVKAATAHTLLDFARKAETVTNVDVEYASHTSSITPPPEDSPLWQTESPAWELGKYIWQRTKMTDGNGNDNYSNPVCIQGAQGTNSAIVYLYKRSASAATIDWTQTLTYSFATNKLTSLPTGWVDDLENLPDNDNPIYVTAATAGSRSDTDTIPYTEWSAPVAMAQNGEDAPKTAVVVLYKRSNTTPAKPTAALTYTFNTAKLTPASSLAGWSQSIPVADGNPCYSIQAVAMAVGDSDVIAATEWTDVTQILSDGLDAYNTAVVYLYMRSATAPSKPSVQTTYTFSDHSLSPVPSGWSRDYIGGSNPLYVTAATASSTESSVTIGANEWSDPVILTQDGAPGSPGANGKNTATVRLYKRASSAPSIDWQNNLTYDFSTNHLTSVPTGWSESVPDGDDDLYATAATASATTSTDTIAASEWATPVCVTKNGLSWSTAAVFLYARADASTDLTKPTQTLDYSFPTGKLSRGGQTGPTILGDWSQEIPASNGKPCFVIQATAVSDDGQTDTIAPSEWSDISKLVADGENGAPGANGRNTVVLYLYKRASTAPSIDWTKTLTYTFATNSLSELPTGWSRDIPSGTDSLYVTAATATSTEATDTIPYTEWTTPIMMAQNGQAGNNGRNTAVLYLYKRASSAPSIDWSNTLTYTFATNTLSPIPSGWDRSIPSGNDPLYVTAATASSTEATDTIDAGEWSAPVIMAQNGAAAEAGVNTATVFLYARADSASALTKPTGTLTYTFSTGALTPASRFTGWSQQIPAANGKPCFVIQATAISQQATDTIAKTEWSNIALFVTDGENGTPGLNSATVFLYARAASASALTKPTSALTYTFASGVLANVPSPWSQEIPESNENPCFMIQATAINTAATDTIDASDWSDITLFVSDGENGEPGLNSATVFLYARAASASALTKPSSNLTYTFSSGALTPASGFSGWSQTIPDSDANGNPCFVIQATAANTTATDVIGSGEWSDIKKLVVDGADGRSIVSITEYYARSKVNTTAPSSWSTTVPTLTTSYKYLWNYEVITYSTMDPQDPTQHETQETAKRVIGVYGNTGTAGKGISSIVNHYLATASGSGVTKETSGWTETIQSMTPVNKYLWNYETINYTSGDPDESDPTIIGVYGDTGKGISSVQEQYYLSTSSSEASGGSWQATQPAWERGKYIWTRSKIVWSDNSTTYTTPICASAINGANEAVVNLDDSLTQNEVFKRLTNGFNTEGIFLENGRLFVNSTGIATGFIHDKATVGGTNVTFYNEQNNIASRDYAIGDYITHDSYACQAKKAIYAHEWINNSSAYTTNVTRLGTVYGESSNVATRDYAVNDYIVFGGNLYQATVAIPTGTTISSSGFKNCNLLGTCYIQTSYYATQAYSSGNYIKSSSNLYQATTSIASGDMIFPGANVNYLSLGSMYHNYWNLNTGQFVTARGLIAGFNIGESTYNGSSWSSLFYMSAMRDNVYNWGYPYSAVNTPVQGVGLRGSSDSVNLGFNIISQGRMYVNNANTNYAGRIRMSAGMLYFDLGLSPTSVNSSWTTAAYINPWSGTGGTGLNINGNLAVTGNFAASGSKSRLIETDGYGKRLLYSYETPSPMFGDVGEGEIGNDGLCYIWLEPIFAQSIDEGQYQVFLQKYGEGDCYISERNSKYFVVKGTIGLTFGWELKAKQKEYTMTRLEVFDDTPVSGSGADNLIERTEEYLQNLREGRVTQ